jgi:hypothetical protein
MSNIKVLTTRLAIAAGLSAVLIINARSYDSPVPQNRPLELLKQGHSLSVDLNSFDRTYALLTLLKNGKDILPKDEYREWCNEMGREARHIVDGWDRVAQEKNTLLRLAAINPIEALHDYSSIEDPQPQADGTFPEDVRADGARELFAQAWKFQTTMPAKFEVLRDIETEALRIGRTGEYPYQAMGDMIVTLADIHTPEATTESEKIIRDAVHFYRDEPNKFLNRDQQFAAFLDATSKAKFPDNKETSDLLAEAVGVFVNKVQHSPKDMDYISEITTPKGSVRFTDDNSELLFAEFPTLKGLAPELTDKLKRQNPEFEKAVRPMQRITGGYVAFDKDAREILITHGKIAQADTVRQLPKPNDPAFAANLDKTLKSIAGLSDDVIRIEGYTAIMPGLYKMRQTEARQIYDRERSRLQGLESEDEHLKAAVALAKASDAIGDRPSLIDLTNSALREGALMFQQDSRVRPDWPLSGRRGFRDLSALVGFTAPKIFDTVHLQVSQIDDPSLKANLLAFEAGALHEAEKVK